MTTGQYMPAAMCRRGHTITTDATNKPLGAHCELCGAKVLGACPTCGNLIRGYYSIPGVFYSPDYTPPDFCHACGSPYPWAGRQARIYQLQNLLDDEQLDSADELVVREQLGALMNEDVDEQEQVRRWKRIKDAAPDFLLKAASQPIVASLITGVARKELGLPPT